MGFLPLHRSSHIAVSFVKSSVKKVQTINRLSLLAWWPLPLRSSIYLTAFHVSSSLDRVLIGFCFNLRQTFIHMLFFLLLVLSWCFYMLTPFLRGLPASLLNCEILSCFSVKSHLFAFCFPLRILLCLALSFDNGKWNIVWATTLSFISRAQYDSFLLLKNNENNVRNIEFAYPKNWNKLTNTEGTWRSHSLLSEKL